MRKETREELAGMVEHKGANVIRPPFEMAVLYEDAPEGEPATVTPIARGHTIRTQRKFQTVFGRPIWDETLETAPEKPAPPPLPAG